MHHRSSSSMRSMSPPSPRNSPLLPSATVHLTEKGLLAQSDGPRIFGMPLKYVSLVTLAVQNAALSIVMHHSRISTPTSLSYSPATAVLLNELLKGSISFVIALSRTREASDSPRYKRGILSCISTPFWTVCSEIFSPDCWKLSIPALLYVIQNSLQFVAISNLPVASFQVTYQMKILTTAAFSVALLRKKLSSTKWLALLFLAIGVGIVQIQTATSTHVPKNTAVGSAHDFQNFHVMSPTKGFAAVTAACFTSGLAGVYFEMVLKNSKADLWVRNVQLSLFSLVPALVPVLYDSKPSDSQGFVSDLFRNFGTWAWATVGIQVFGGLVTAIVIKYSDNILKGFATSLSIVIAFLASVLMFDYHITPSFVIGASTVLSATWMYNQPAGKEPAISIPGTNISMSTQSGKTSAFPPGFSPAAPNEPILGQFSSTNARKKSTVTSSSPRVLASALGISVEVNAPVEKEGDLFGDTFDTGRYHCAPYGSPYTSRPPSRASTPLPLTPQHTEDPRSAGP